METYEEEGEIIPDCVINYYTVDGNNQPVPFSVLPLVWSEDETPGNSDTHIFICGIAVTGQKMYKKIIAWRPEISYALPMIYVLSKKKLWMQLQRPGRSFEDDIMSTLITVHCLHFLKWNLKADGSALWTHLHKAFSTYEVTPSKRHLLSHLPLIKEVAKRDKDLAKSELLPTLLLEIRTCEANHATKKITFEADGQEDYEDTDGDDHDDHDETFDSVCVLCADGGELIRMEESLKGKKSSSNVRIAEDKTFTEGKKQLNINLAPFLHGKRYTYFGRHFTKVRKLELIVDKLKWYVQDGDTIVDICCGANDFSCLMRERLHKMGKICSFKNYDLFTPKNDFNFEQKDWMTVTSEELPAGSNLIMGLNPPFGVNGNLANKFIDKALTFKPKLLILIVPIETERLDRKKESPYDNIWEDHHILSGKAFYLPGSVDVYSKQLEQHNNFAPPLYLWSRPDWTAKHKTIAVTCGHRTVTDDPRQMGKMDTGENHDGMYEEDMEVDPPIYFPSNSADQKSWHEWNLKGFYPSHYTTGMQHSSGVSDAAAIGVQHPYVVSDAGEGVHQGAFPPSRQYPTEP